MKYPLYKCKTTNTKFILSLKRVHSKSAIMLIDSHQSLLIYCSKGHCSQTLQMGHFGVFFELDMQIQKHPHTKLCPYISFLQEMMMAELLLQPKVVTPILRCLCFFYDIIRKVFNGERERVCVHATHNWNKKLFASLVFFLPW